MSKAIGIDLGTCNSAAAFAMGREVTVVRSSHGTSLYGKGFPSFVRFDYDGKMQAVGKPAKDGGLLEPELLVWGVKRLVGLSYQTVMERHELDRFKYNVEEGPGGSILIKVGEARYTPVDILGFILSEIKKDAENTRVNSTIGPGIEEAVVSVPAYFDGTRTGCIVEAAKKAGFARVRTIAEPTAAAMWYAFHTGADFGNGTRVLTFDLGAGTLDVSILLLLSQNGKLVLGGLSTSGDEKLGGMDMDDILVSYLTDKYNLKDVLQDNANCEALTFRDEVEKGKISLSSERETRVFLRMGPSQYLTREELEEVLKPLLDRCRGPIRVALEQAGLQASDLDLVLFVGGPTYMPCVRATVKDELARLGAKEQLLRQLETTEGRSLPVDPMECVARGAGLDAGGVAKLTVKSHPHGYGTTLGPVPGLPDYYYFILPVNSPYPIKKSKGTVVYSPNALRVPTALIRKRPHDQDGRTVYEYVHLGSYDCYIRSIGDDPKVDITMELDENGNLVTAFTHKQTGESVRFEKLDTLEGKKIELQETTPPEPRGASQDGSTARREWTQDQLDRAVHVAQTLVDSFEQDTQDSKVADKKEELCGFVQAARDPRATPSILNRTQELLNALRLAGVIAEADFLCYLESLREIERTV